MINSGINIFHFIILGIILFSTGIFGFTISNNLIKRMFCFIIMLNAICINFAAISQYCDGIKTEGSSFGVFISVINLVIVIILTSWIINNKDKLKG